MGEVMTVDELRSMIMDEELMKDLPLSKAMLDFIVELIKKDVN